MSAPSAESLPDSITAEPVAEGKFSLTAIVVRVVLPLLLVGVGVAAYSYLAIPIEQEKTPPAEKQDIRTNVQQLFVQDYQVIIRTNGIVQAHNEVALSVEVAGQVKRIHPSFEVGSTFKKGDVLVEVDASDYETALAISRPNLKARSLHLNLRLWSMSGIKNSSKRTVSLRRKSTRLLLRRSKRLQSSIRRVRA